MAEVFAGNLARVGDRIDAALRRAGRERERVTVVAVTKNHGPGAVEEAIRAGVADIGENRVQEFLEKSAQVSGECRWHLVGHLQRNKATKVIGRVALIHSVDSVALATTLDRLGATAGVVTSILLQVNTSKEESKYGFSPAQTRAAAGAVARLDHVRLAGLMTMGPADEDPVETRTCFRELLALRERLRGESELELPELSMGMSGDFEIAVEEGATIVRLGRVLLGERG